MWPRGGWVELAFGMTNPLPPAFSLTHTHICTYTSLHIHTQTYTYTQEAVKEPNASVVLGIVDASARLTRNAETKVKRELKDCLAQLQQVPERRLALLSLTNDGPLVLCTPLDKLATGLGVLSDYVATAATQLPAEVGEQAM